MPSIRTSSQFSLQGTAENSFNESLRLIPAPAPPLPPPPLATKPPPSIPAKPVPPPPTQPPPRSPPVAPSPPLIDSTQCKKTPKNQLVPKGGRTLLIVKGIGARTFWCNNSTLELTGDGRLHGDGKAKLKSTDGQWTGNLLFRTSDGLPQWSLKNKETKKAWVVVANAKPEARQDAPNGDPLTWDRRKVVKSDGPRPQVWWVVRTNTTSGDLPTKCKGDRDEIVPFTAVYEFIACS